MFGSFGLIVFFATAQIKVGDEFSWLFGGKNGLEVAVVGGDFLQILVTTGFENLAFRLSRQT